METLAEVVDSVLEHQLKPINDQILTLDKSVSSLEKGLKEVPSKKDDSIDYVSTIVMLFGYYQELKEEFINLGRSCMNLKDKYPDLPDCSINREYKIKQRLAEIRQTFNSLLYSPPG